MNVRRLSPNVLDMDCAVEAARIRGLLTHLVRSQLGRRGVVIALSGGVDSSVCAALAVQALGPERTFALLLPERESSAAGTALARRLAEQLGMPYVTQDITSALEAIGCYRSRDEAIRALFPEYGQGWRSKLVIQGGLSGGLNFFALVVSTPEGVCSQRRLPPREYLQIVGAQNFKQRVRKAIEYFHADRLRYAVLGTPNRLEYDQGFFVKNGDGSADVKPIAHLYKTQVYAMARHLGLPREICESVPSSDTYSMAQTQDEFFFGLPYSQLDLALWAFNHDVPAAVLAGTIGISEDQARLIYRDIVAKRQSAQYQHARPLLADHVTEVRILG